ncbi:MAG TPA: RedB protein [Phycisphaerae bacterium]|nr:RedB protein [Phycisphaerae bacterium]
MKRRLLVTALACALWVGGVSVGAVELFRYDATASAAGAPAAGWPAGTRLVPGSAEATLVMGVHPQCPCSRATMDELAVLAAHCQGRLRMYVLMVCPRGATADWAKTSLWTSAAAIPGVTVIADLGGSETRRFGLATSGETLLYGADLRLEFSGGITESRGHAGDNAGESAIEALVKDPSAFGVQTTRTPVYGCALFSAEDRSEQLPGGDSPAAATEPGIHTPGIQTTGGAS